MGTGRLLEAMRGSAVKTGASCLGLELLRGFDSDFIRISGPLIVVTVVTMVSESPEKRKRWCPRLGLVSTP